MSIADQGAAGPGKDHPVLLRLAGPLGWTLAAIALLALAYEFISFAESGTYRPIPAGELWFAAHVASLNLTQAMVQRYLHPFLWDPIIATVLRWPAWSLLGAPGAILVAIAPNRRA